MIYFLILLTSAFGLIYELLLSSIASYLIGNTITQFSLTIGIFLFGLGIGSYISNLIKNPSITYIKIEILLGFLGGYSILIIKTLYLFLINYFGIFYFLYFLIVLTIGILVGIEVPLLAKIIYEKEKKYIIGNVFSLDNIGAVIGTFIFPFLLLPFLGLTYTSLLIGFLNLISLYLFIYTLKFKYIKIVTISLISYIIIFINIYKFDNYWYNFFYKEPIVLKKQTKYQEIIITKKGNNISLFLDGNLQFNSSDEHRYHESIANFLKNKKDILILGGGDGMLAKYLSGNIDLVEIDEEIIKISKTHPLIKRLNNNSLEKVNVIIEDAFNYIIKNNKKYDAIVADLIDPRDISSAKLYSLEFYKNIKKSLKSDGIFITQAGNAYFGKEVFRCIYKTISQVFENVIPYKVYIPSFGDRGFIIAYTTGYINTKNLMLNFNFDKDYIVDLNKLEINTLNNPVLIKYYNLGLKRFYE